MAGLNALLSERLQKKSKSPKMAQLAVAGAEGNLSSFSGMFPQVDLTEHEKEFIEALLNEYASDKTVPENDLQKLSHITSEVKAINAQAAYLHGERVFQAQNILKNYREGAFTSWLIAAYGNRQSPYNFLQYYQFIQSLPSNLRPQIEKMPRQAIYTLASREGSLTEKQKFVEGYQGETKYELLQRIRELFPLHEADKRQKNSAEEVLFLLIRAEDKMRSSKFRPTKKQKKTLLQQIDNLFELIEDEQ